MEQTFLDLVDKRDYYVVNELLEAYYSVSETMKNPFMDRDDLKKTRKALKRVLAYYGKVLPND